MLNSLFLTENGTVYKIVGKYGRAGQDIIRRMRFACWITEATDTHSDQASSSFFFSFLSFSHTSKPLERQDLLVTENSRTTSDTPHSVGHLWTSDLPVAETLTTLT